MLNLLARQDCRWFIHDDKSSIYSKSFGYLYQLLFGDREGRDQTLWINGQSHTLEQIPRLLYLTPTVNQAPLPRLSSEKQVLGDSQMWCQCKFLVDHGDTKSLGRARPLV